MKRLFFLVGIALILGPVSGFAAEQTWSGQISDSMCNADHQAMAQDGKKVDARECTLACTKGGAKYIFVSDGKVYAINNSVLFAIGAVPEASTAAMAALGLATVLLAMRKRRSRAA